MKSILYSFIASLAVVAGSLNLDKPIAEEARYSNGTAGAAVSISANSLNYLKQQLLPFLYKKVAKVSIHDQSFHDFGLKFDLTNIDVQIPEPDLEIIDLWKTSMNSTSNSVGISNANQDLTIEFDFNFHIFNVIRLVKGHFKATVKDIFLKLDLQLKTQDVKGRQALAIDIPADNFQLSGGDIEFHVTGGVTDFITQSIIRLFKKKILSFVVKESKGIITNKLVNSINSDFAKYATINLDTLAIDTTVTRPPLITDDSLLSIFLNGTVENTSPIFNTTDKKQVSFSNFEIGNIAKQDLMIHISQEWVQSVGDALNGGINITKIASEYFNHRITFDSFCRFIPQGFCGNTPDRQLNFIFGLDKQVDLTLTDDQFAVSNAGARFQIQDGVNGTQYIDYILNELNIAGYMKSNPKYCELLGQMETFQFSDFTIIQNVFKNLDMNEFMSLDSGRFNDARNALNNYLASDPTDTNHRYKEIVWNGYFMFKEMELKVVPGMIFYGFEFDNLFIGKPQTWTSEYEAKAPKGLFMSQPQGKTNKRTNRKGAKYTEF